MEHFRYPSNSTLEYYLSIKRNKILIYITWRNKIYPNKNVMYVCYAFVLGCVWLCDPMDCSPAGSSVHWIFHSRIMEWVAMSFSRESSWPRDWTCILCVSCIVSLTLYYHAKMLCWVNKTHIHTHKEYIQYEFLSYNSTNFRMKKISTVVASGEVEAEVELERVWEMF